MSVFISRQSKKFIRNFDYKRGDEFLNLTKEQIRWTIGIFTGHGKFRYHLKKIKMRDDDTCRYCRESQETAEHLLCDCDALIQKRKQVLEEYYLNPTDLDGYKLSRIYEFLEKIGIVSDND